MSIIGRKPYRVALNRLGAAFSGVKARIDAECPECGCRKTHAVKSLDAAKPKRFCIVCDKEYTPGEKTV